MKPVRTYTHLDKKEKVFGLEVLDFLVLALVYGVVFVVSVNIFVNLMVVGGAYVLLRLYKKGKPPKYTATLIRFIVTPKHFTLSGRDSV